MWRVSRVARDFRTQKLADVSSQVIARKVQAYDHLVVDMGASLGAGLHICRDLIGPERDHEVSRYITKNVVGQVMRKIKPKKSITFLFDGSAPLWVANRTRKVSHKKSESRFSRSAGSTLPYAVEDKMRGAVLDTRDAPPEVLISGAATVGPMEAKLSQWALDMASRADVTANDQICLLGSQDLFVSALGMTPFHNVTTMVMNRGEFKQLPLQDLFEWLALSDVFAAGDNVRLSAIRADLTLVALLANGCGATELATLPNCAFRDGLEVYHTEYVTKGRTICAETPAGLAVHAAAFSEFLTKVTKRTVKNAREDAASADYVQMLLQSHAMLLDGGIKDYSFLGQEAIESKPPPLQPEKLLCHLKTVKQEYLLPSTSDDFAMTAAEQLLAGSLNADYVQSSLPAFTGGHGLPEAQSAMLMEKPDARAAHEYAESMLRAIHKKHRALRHTPSHYWTRKPGEPGPPPGWAYTSVVLGQRSKREATRRRLAQQEASGAVVSQKKKNPLTVFDEAAGKWVEGESSLPGNPHPATLRVVSWNVQFDRYSGKTTPLGKPGIDWCTRTRYVALAQALEATDADIIAMQETEPTWWEFLSRQPWVQQRYCFSTDMKGEQITPWGQMLLVHRRVPVVSMAATNVPGFSGHTSVMPGCVLQLTPDVTLQVHGVHLLAPYTQNNVGARVSQIETLMKRLSPKAVGSDVVVMGDFNDYPSNFFVMPSAMGDFKDAWPAVHGEDGDAGYTINGRRSKYTSLIIEPEFFGRADRVIAKSKHLAAKDAVLLGTRTVREVLNTAACPEYLHPSDHFGLQVTYDVVA